MVYYLALAVRALPLRLYGRTCDPELPKHLPLGVWFFLLLLVTLIGVLSATAGGPWPRCVSRVLAIFTKSDIGFSFRSRWAFLRRSRWNSHIAVQQRAVDWTGSI